MFSAILRWYLISDNSLVLICRTNKYSAVTGPGPHTRQSALPIVGSGKLPGRGDTGHIADISVGNRGNINLGWYFCSQVLNNKTSLWYVSCDLRLPSSPRTQHPLSSYQTLFINGGFFVSRGLLHKNIRSPSLSSFSRKLSCIIQN